MIIQLLIYLLYMNQYLNHKLCPMLPQKAVEMLTKTVALELADKGIRVNGIAPGCDSY
jgi:enoyl-[acyl-carrier-protein] reductase (NADH)